MRYARHAQPLCICHCNSLGISLRSLTRSHPSVTFCCIAQSTAAPHITTTTVGVKKETNNEEPALGFRRCDPADRLPGGGAVLRPERRDGEPEQHTLCSHAGPGGAAAPR